MVTESTALHRESVGAGPPIVLAHGFSGSARNWRPQVRALRDRHRVVTYDLRGHARSPAPHDAEALYTLDAFVEDVDRLLDEEAIERPVLGGLSLGAAVMLGHALAHPTRSRGLVLASLPAGPDRAGAFRGRAEDLASALEREGSDAAGARFVWGPDSGLDARGAALVRQGFLEHDPLGLAQVLRGVLREVGGLLDAVVDSGATLTMPVLLIVGEQDAGSLESARRLARELPQARLEVVPKAGHVVNLAAPGPVNELLLDFLASLPPG
ncbi:MAG: alpha/beta fold hydrolase [Spirochaetaceae bacterium]|nr:alpha/beta fold hydrolase [Myxococcales bacterium]MCB9723351.1 alpha/beta fold hydrolase [Spirochaetaceae bacterium]